VAGHQQVWVKINAPVDEGIALLIEALSLFPPLQTSSSCQGHDNRAASITFRYGDSGDWKDLANFVFGTFGPKLAARVGDVIELAVEVTTWGDAVGRLSIRPGCIQQVCDAVKVVADELGVVTLRMSGCSDDTPYTSQ